MSDNNWQRRQEMSVQVKPHIDNSIFCCTCMQINENQKYAKFHFLHPFLIPAGILWGILRTLLCFQSSCRSCLSSFFSNWSRLFCQNIERILKFDTYEILSNFKSIKLWNLLNIIHFTKVAKSYRVSRKTGNALYYRISPHPSH